MKSSRASQSAPGHSLSLDACPCVSRDGELSLGHVLLASGRVTRWRAASACLKLSPWDFSLGWMDPFDWFSLGAISSSRVATPG